LDKRNQKKGGKNILKVQEKIAKYLSVKSY